MEKLLPFKEAMRLAWLEYREAKMDVMANIANGLLMATYGGKSV